MTFRINRSIAKQKGSERDTMNSKENDLIPVAPEVHYEGQNHEEEDSLAQELSHLFSDSIFLGEIHVPDGYAYLRADCGDAMEVFLAIRDQRIQKARFDTLGCGFTIACGCTAMNFAEGTTLSGALQIAPGQILEALGKRLPPSHYHCAELATETLKKAINDYLLRNKDFYSEP